MIRHVRSQLNLRGNHDRRLDRQFWMIVADHDRRRSDLLHRQLGKLALGSLQFVAIAAAATTAGGWCSFFGVIGNCGVRSGAISVTVSVSAASLTTFAPTIDSAISPATMATCTTSETPALCFL